jgi:anti-sigma-K factor RskA
MGERHRKTNGEHAWARGLLGPYVLGALDPKEEKVVERHVARCAACRNEEHELRETHERLAGASIAVSSTPPDLKERVFTGLPSSGRSGAPTGAARGALRGTSRTTRATVAAAAVICLFALAAMAAYSAGFFSQETTTSTLVATELAPEAGGELEVRDSGQNAEASLEVWGLPQTGPNEYYELWCGREGGRVSAGTFTVDDRGRGTLSAICPEVAGDYQRFGITLEEFPEEPRIENARVVLRGELQSS